MGRRKQTRAASERQHKGNTQVSEVDSSRAADPTDETPTPEMTGKRRGPRPGTDAARRGGKAVAEKYGREFYSTIGSKGGRAAKEQLGLDFYASIGHRGGETTQKTYGKEHYARIGRIGGQHGKGRPKLRAGDRLAMQALASQPGADASTAPAEG